MANCVLKSEVKVEYRSSSLTGALVLQRLLCTYSNKLQPGCTPSPHRLLVSTAF